MIEIPLIVAALATLAVWPSLKWNKWPIKLLSALAILVLSGYLTILYPGSVMRYEVTKLRTEQMAAAPTSDKLPTLESHKKLLRTVQSDMWATYAAISYMCLLIALVPYRRNK